MGIPTDLYRHSLGLLTDLYQITMAFAAWKLGLERQEAVFHLFFRRNPFGGGFCVACGLASAVDLMEHVHFDRTDLEFLGGLTGRRGAPLFDPAFLDWLGQMRFTCDVDAVPEGTAVFPQEPLLRLAGPVIQGMLLETPLLNALNFQTLVATKSARVCHAARDRPVIEFGLRRAQGIDGALAASRAAYVGGCEATSNVLAGKLFGIPVRGTHAHSWVMLFDSELEAFEAFARAMPDNCVLLVDTYQTLAGVRHAVEVGSRLRQEGHDLAGIRLDSGDLAYLSIEARKILDAAGLTETTIVASNDLDEHIIASLHEQGAAIDSWGVGTRLASCFDEPALPGVYKLTATREPGGDWEDRVKVSEQPAKTTTPGILQVRRYRHDGAFAADMIYDVRTPPAGEVTLVDPLDMTRRKVMPAGAPHEDLLVPVFRAGARVYVPPDLAAVRDHARDQLSRLHAGVKRFVYPHVYPVGLERTLHERKTALVLAARGAPT